MKCFLLFFTGKGYAVLTAYDGEETLKKIERPAGYYLAGCEYAGMDGFEVAAGAGTCFLPDSFDSPD